MLNVFAFTKYVQNTWLYLQNILARAIYILTYTDSKIVRASFKRDFHNMENYISKYEFREGELWGVYYKYFEENGPCYKGTTLYILWATLITARPVARHIYHYCIHGI